MMRKRLLSFILFFLIIIQMVPSLALAANTDISLTVPKEYSIDGKTSYSLTRQEYQNLLGRVHDYVQDELNKISSRFYDIASVTANDDCTEVTAVIWNAQLTLDETNAEKGYFDLCSIYAAYAQKKLDKLNIVYKNAIDEVLWTTTADTGQPTASSFTRSSSTQSTTSKQSSSTWQSSTSQSTATQNRSTSRSKSSGSAWIPATGKCYHSIPNCGRMNPKKATLVDVEWAERNGYTRCSKCW